MISFFDRDELKSNMIIMLNNKPCRIINVLGSGTSSIVYRAEMPICIAGFTCDRAVVLKELYPMGLDIGRKDDMSLDIPGISLMDFKRYTDRFKKACKRQIQFHNYEKTTNITTDLQDMYEVNNTLYSVMGIVTGNSYDKELHETILSILNVGMCLANCISKYHEMGYLHLDIKPENIFKEKLTGDNVNIKLFDFDTVSTKKEVLDGEFSYSEGYEAPEVSGSYNGLFSFSDIDERADIYSIGAIIFEKIMGQVPDFSDQRNGKIWDLSHNSYLKDAVPQLQKEITDLFRRTLARRKENRYSSADELKDTFKKLINLAGNKVFLKNQRIAPCTPRDIYIPRKDVLSELAKRLDEKHILYLHALGGSGKSETAREYAEQYADKYDFIQSVFYSGNLKKTIANLDFVGLKDEDRFAHTDEDIDRLYNYKYGLLGNTSVYGTNTLLIIDNYNPTSEEVIHNQEVISRLRDLHINILFTTRVKPTDISECFDLENMVPEELKALFFRINPKNKDKPERIAIVDEIIKLSYNHTMTVKLVAMQSAEYMKPLEEYRDVLQEKGLNSGFESEIINEKDGRLVVEDSVYNHIRALFKLNDLKPKQKYIMVNACLLPLSGLEASTFSQYIDLAHFESSSGSDFLDPEIKKLVNSGWIEYADTSEKRFTAETKITLHPLICDIVKNELKPELTDDKCRKFYISFLDLIQEWGNNKFSNNNIYLELENNVLCLFPKLNNIFSYQPVCDVINNLLVCDDDDDSASSIVDYSIRFRGEILQKDLSYCYGVYLSNCFSIEEEYTISPEIMMIDEATFDNCCFLKKIYIDNPNDIDQIYSISFYNCSIKEFIVLNSPFYSSYDGALYDFEKTKLIRCPTAKEKISIAEGVTEVQYDSFTNCNIAEINFPNSMVDISFGAFQKLDIKKINLPEGIVIIPFDAFRDCKYLECVHLPSTVKIIGSGAFNGCSSLKYINFPKSLEVISSGAFKNCKSLKEIITLDNLKEINDFAFCGCENLETVIVPQTLEHIGSLAFGECLNLKNINVNRPTRVSYDAFCGCMSLMKCMDVNIKIENNSMIWASRDGNVLMGVYDKSIKSYVMQDNISYLGAFCFKNYDNLNQITLNNNLNVIMDYAFQNCVSLEKIIIPDSVDTISTGAFENCCSLKEIKLSKNMGSISDRTFFNCKKLVSIFIPDSVEKIGNSAFASCESLHQIFLPNTLTQLGDLVFENCHSINNLDFLCSSGITEISVGAFMGCKSLVHIKIPDQIVLIEQQAFANCENIQSVTLSQIETIEALAFAYCTSLKIINFSKTIEEIEEAAFINSSSLKTLTLPENIEYVGSAAFANCDFLNDITVLNFDMHIDDLAFGYIVSCEKESLLECEGEKQNEFIVGDLIEKNENLIIHGYKNSTAEKYAQENGFKFVPLD